MTARLAPLTLLTLVLASACQAPVVVLLAPEAADLLPGLQAALPAVEAQTGLQYELVAAGQADAGTQELLYLSAQTALPDAFVPLPVVKSDRPTGYSAAPAFGAQSAGLVLFWDMPGVTVFSQELPIGEPEGLRSWAEPARGWPAVKKLVVAGAEADLRWVAWLGQSASQGALPTTKMFQDFSLWLARPWWSPDAWRLTRADAAQQYQGGKGVAFVETFRDFYRANPAGFRRFFPLASGPVERPQLSGATLTLQARGGALAAQAWQAWSRVLLSVDFQRQFSQKTGWMPANLSAPVLETASAQARRLLIRAASFTPTFTVTPAVRDQLQALFQNPAQFTN